MIAGAALLALSIAAAPAPSLTQTTSAAPAATYGSAAALALASSGALPSDPDAATEAYLATMSPETRARSDAYFEGGEKLQLVDFLWNAAIALALLFSGVSARLRDLAERLTKRRFLQTAAYAAGWIALVTIATFPLDVYEGFVREHAYGLSTQSFGGWLGDQAKALAIALIAAAIVVPVLYAVLRRAPRTWWIWGAAVMLGFAMLTIVIAPVWIEPVFNAQTKLTDPAVRDPILRIAHADGLAANDVWVIDESRQTNRVSAHVTGFLGTERVELNDNLLARCSLPEIEAVLGHEIGHYVLHHVEKMLLFLAIVIVALFAWLRWASARTLARFGARWRVRDVADPAGLPMMMLLLSIAGAAISPAMNGMVRQQESEADLFGLNTARQPDGMAVVTLKLADYRKMSPGPIEEILFYDHPSGRERIEMAMRWKAAQRAEPK